MQPQEYDVSVLEHVPPFTHELLSQLSVIHEPSVDPCVVKPLAQSAVTMP